MDHSLDVLLDGLASPDPSIRDGWAYSELYLSISQGRFKDDLDQILATATDRLGAEEIWTRSFAALVLTWLAASGSFSQESFDAFARWYPNEADTRGFDHQHGWLHAAAHGADYLGLVANRELIPATRVLELIAQRLISPATAWHDQEDARITRAIMLSLRRCSSLADATQWLTSITKHVTEFETAIDTSQTPVLPPEWVHNLCSTLTKTHFALAVNPADFLPEGYRAAVQSALATLVVRLEDFVIIN